MKKQYIPAPNQIADFVDERDMFGQIRPKRINIIKRARHKLINAPDLKVKYARLGVRIIATFFDLIIVFSVLLILETFLFKFNYDNKYSILYRFVIAAFIWIFYNTFFESSGYQATVGKILFQLKVIDLYGKRLSVLKATVRCISKAFSILPIGLGIWYITTDPKKQGWHDLISGSYVIKS
jgi:uncharacterized RDD family membrane protein YckC